MGDNNMEYERKFLVKEDYLNIIKSEATSFMDIKQTYLSFSPELRIREISCNCGKKTYTMTIKKKQKEGRYEKEMKIRKSTYLDLYKNKEGIDLYKTRYNIPLLNSELIAELDIYKNFDLVIVEVEFKNVGDMKKFIPPEWFGEDISANPNFKIKQWVRDN